MYIDDINLFAKRRKITGNPYTGSENIRWRYRDEIWDRKMRHANNEKRETTNEKVTEIQKIRILREKETNKYLGIQEAEAIKQVEMKQKIKKNTPRER